MKRIKVNIIYGTKTKGDIAIILAEELAKLYKQGCFDSFLKEANKNIKSV